MTTAPLQPLAGMRVLDLSGYLPGPLLARILADLGADVIKVEPPHGDPARFTPPLVDQQSAAFAALNFGKRSVALNLKKPEGVDLFLGLTAACDVVVESFRPGVLERLGIGYGTLAARQPRIILCSISGYGQDGPLRDAAGHDLNYAARVGLLSLGGPADTTPAMPGVQTADVGGGALSGVIGVLAALLERERTGRGRHLDISMARSAAVFLTMEAGRRGGGEPEPRGAGILTGGPPCYRIYETADHGFMALGALEPKFFAAFCTRAGLGHLASDGFASGEHGAEVHAELEAAFGSRPRAEWVELLSDCDCCCEPVQTIEEGLADPGLGLRFVDLDGVPGLLHHLGAPTPSPSNTAVPTLGEHNREVCAELGVEANLIAAAASAGAVDLG